MIQKEQKPWKGLNDSRNIVIIILIKRPFSRKNLYYPSVMQKLTKILLATTNPGKRQEILSALHPLEGIELLSLDDLGISSEIQETGTSYAENALLKAKGYFDLVNIAEKGFTSRFCPVIAEDSGAEIAALQGELGYNTRHWGAGKEASDEEWLNFFMNRMAHEQDRGARFVCHAIYFDDQGYHTFEGECLGEICHEIEAPIQKGIPLSAVFKPFGAAKVYSAMSEEEKNQLSHRGKAMKKLRKFLLSL